MLVASCLRSLRRPAPTTGGCRAPQAHAVLRESGSRGWALAAAELLLPAQVAHKQMKGSMALRQNQAVFPKGAPASPRSSGCLQRHGSP